MGLSDDTGENLAAFLEGDPAATESLRGAVRTVVRSFRFKGEPLDELVQDVLERTFFSVKAGRFRGDSSLKTYAQNIARYACLERLRRTRLEISIEVVGPRAEPSASDPEKHLLRREEFERDLELLKALPEECRELFRLVFIEELTYQQVAERLGLSEGAVKSRVRRCRLAHLWSSAGDGAGARAEAGASHRRRAGRIRA